MSDDQGRLAVGWFNSHHYRLSQYSIAPPQDYVIAVLRTERGGDLWTHITQTTPGLVDLTFHRFDERFPENARRSATDSHRGRG
ncbi:hypothetical protein [Rhodococcus globerulus]|uniref:hypothetical protein n=1 Tax=Rhodococcus globerulus TaxID=33008 RepID=UPI0012BA09B7|nr:hypothetical protein [Rhodococcus globerulus]